MNNSSKFRNKQIGKKLFDKWAKDVKIQEGISNEVGSQVIDRVSDPIALIVNQVANQVSTQLFEKYK